MRRGSTARLRADLDGSAIQKGERLQNGVPFPNQSSAGTDILVSGWPGRQEKNQQQQNPRLVMRRRGCVSLGRVRTKGAKQNDWFLGAIANSLPLCQPPAPPPIYVWMNGRGMKQVFWRLEDVV